MNYEPYLFNFSDNRLFYGFNSVSVDKTIPKLVVFTPVDGNEIYNLALVDIEDGRLTDQAVSNNQDMPIVLATVAAILEDFLAHHASATVIIEGNTPARTRLYRVAISVFLDDLNLPFEVFGKTENEQELFQRNKPYLRYLIKRKT